MKKSLLFVAAACLSMSAMAAPQMMKHQQKSQLEKQLDAQLFTKDFAKQNLNATKVNKAKAQDGPIMGAFPGTPSVYSLSGYVEGYFDYDIPAQAQVEDDVVYFSGILPGIFSETVVIKANREGNTITIPAQKVYNQFNLWDMYICDVYVGLLNPETAEFMEGEAYPLELNADGTIVTPTDEDYFLGAFVDVSAYGFGDREFITYNVDFMLEPFDCQPEVQLPEGAEPLEYVYKYEVGGAVYADLAAVYVDGNDVYMNGLTGGYYSWVKGTMENGKVTIPSGQFVGVNAAYLYTVEGVTNVDVDVTGYINSWESIPALTFTVTEDGFVLDEDQSVALQYGSGFELGYLMQNVAVTKYTGDVIAKPQTPEFLEFPGYMAEYDQYPMAIYFPNTGTEGEYIRPENMEWAIWVDGGLYTFSPDEGYFLDEDMDWFPAAAFYDNESYDILGEGCQFTVYLYDGLFNEIGLQSRNTVDGVTMYSDIRYIDVMTFEERVEEVENDIPVSLNGVQTAKVTNLFDLQGRRADKAAKGLVIRNGQVNFIK